MAARIGPKVGQIGHKWDKSGTFSDQISVHFGSAEPKCTEIRSENVWDLSYFGQSLATRIHILDGFIKFEKRALNDALSEND